MYTGSSPSILSLVVALTAGIGLGFLFYGGLWWTVNRLAHARRPALLFAGSFLVRTVVVLAGIYFVTAGQWQLVAACIAGFIGVRMVLTRRWGPARRRHPSTA